MQQTVERVPGRARDAREESPQGARACMASPRGLAFRSSPPSPNHLTASPAHPASVPAFSNDRTPVQSRRPSRSHRGALIGLTRGAKARKEDVDGGVRGKLQ
ncbi:hypothetical protein PYCCODRAFT_332757 [Trametes coccinea BRFM310]|uniref:Uncharacterized protein n=1 Tax=Trametes coccinea (strain BRFM310) TaxID=1353009 RepID=A0A1Y2IRV7_TRAC3|nr:hypothetical protein PYCCODRAFT_332757 [Trametes coccinea BRFM310]